MPPPEKFSPGETGFVDRGGGGGGGGGVHCENGARSRYCWFEGVSTPAAAAGAAAR